MKIVYRNGMLTATAESIADINVLLSLSPQTRIEPQKKPGAKKAAWAGTKYKMPCPLCGKRVKYMGPHTQTMHTPEGRVLGGQRPDALTPYPAPNHE